ncbi:DUF3891 family protein [Pseudobacillus wudalianchiensis]|uniref:DUF3891 family protein n=1 Tax=Pseudobacillus wudalianchiensis TaxID=1743143 RepID=UPI0008086E0F|nr:DUF3891 family protein [Bacillus wudalianchiensis]
MIVRERENEFVLIEQDHHARASGDMMAYWRDSLFLGKEWRHSVNYAISQHDCGWKPFDKAPFWNDKKRAPYTFIDFPLSSKLVLYKQGIDQVEERDRYAALLCSVHFSRFLTHEAAEEAKKFVAQEKQRQERLMDSLEILNQSFLPFHYGLLQLGDNLSLYICLNEPGTTKEKEHPFFRNGIPLSPALSEIKKEKIQLYWRDNQTIVLDTFPFKEEITVSIKQKIISKESIAAKGFLESYQKAGFQHMTVRLTTQNN